MENFTPVSGIIGGCLIGIAALCYLYFNGKTMGMSGIVEGFVPPFSPGIPERVFAVFGLWSGGILLRYAYPLAFDFNIDRTLVYIVIAGALVGFGARLGGGCTSGHGVCGVGRLSVKSIVATAIFVVIGITVASAVYLMGI